MQQFRSQKGMAIVSVLLIAIGISGIGATRAQAALPFGLSQYLEKLKPKIKEEVRLSATLGLADGGDKNNNSTIDGGDMIKATYTLVNATTKPLNDFSLNTRVAKENLNFIHNLQGATGFVEKDGQIVFANIAVAPLATVTVSFEARVNWLDAEASLSTEPELLTSDNKSLSKAEKITKKITEQKDNRPSLLKVEKKGGSQ
jgi:hypothetical protein